MAPRLPPQPPWPTNFGLYHAIGVITDRFFVTGDLRIRRERMRPGRVGGLATLRLKKPSITEAAGISGDPAMETSPYTIIGVFLRY